MKGEIEFKLICKCGNKMDGYFAEEDETETLHCKCGYAWTIIRPVREEEAK